MIFNNGNVSVDQHFVRVGSKSYAVDKIGSIDVRTRVQKGETTWIVLWIAAAAAVILAFTGEKYGLLLIALVLGLIGFASYRKRASVPFFSVVLLTNAGEAQAFESTNSEEIMDIRDAIETAMTRR